MQNDGAYNDKNSRHQRGECNAHIIWNSCWTNRHVRMKKLVKKWLFKITLEFAK